MAKNVALLVVTTATLPPTFGFLTTVPREEFAVALIQQTTQAAIHSPTNTMEPITMPAMDPPLAR